MKDKINIDAMIPNVEIITTGLCKCFKKVSIIVIF